MKFTAFEQEMLEAVHGRAAQKAMQILKGLGTIYGAEKMISISSAQISGVSYDNLGEAGLKFLEEMASGGGRVKVLTTLNPAGMDFENWRILGIDDEFACNQHRVRQAYLKMGAVATCTCTPYLSGNLPHFGEHIAWAESSAVCFANSVIGAQTNREGGPGALAAAITGVTPAYGLHLKENRQPGITFEIVTGINGTQSFGALGKVIGEKIEALQTSRIPMILGIQQATLEELKSLCASIATYGGVGLFHIEGITPESHKYSQPEIKIRISEKDLNASILQLSDKNDPVDFVTLGCPHLSLLEIQRIAELLDGNKVTKEFWITTSRPIKRIADDMGYSQIIEASGAKFAVDTCCVVSPIQNRFQCMATDSAKACYYAYAKNHFKTRFLPFDQVVEEAMK